jgi:hypothetical protein
MTSCSLVYLATASWQATDTYFFKEKDPELLKRVDNWDTNFIKNMPRQTDGCVCGDHSVHIMYYCYLIFHLILLTLLRIVCHVYAALEWNNITRRFYTG